LSRIVLIGRTVGLARLAWLIGLVGLIGLILVLIAAGEFLGQSFELVTLLGRGVAHELLSLLAELLGGFAVLLGFAGLVLDVLQGFGELVDAGEL